MKRFLFILCILWLSAVGRMASAAPVWNSAESAWLTAHPVIHVGLVTNPPHAQIDPRTGTLLGYSPAFLVTLQRQLGIHLQPKWYESPEALESAFRSHEIDLTLPAQQTPDALKYAIFSDPYLRLSNKLLVRNDYHGESILEDLYDVRLAVVAGSPVSAFLTRNYPILPQQTYATEAEVAGAVVRGEADIAVLDQGKSTFLIRQIAYARLRMIGDSGYNSLMRIAVRSDWPDFAHILDKAIASVPDTDMRVLYNKWMLPPQPQLLDSRIFWGLITAGLFLLALWMAWLTLVNRRLRRQSQQQLLQLEQDLLDRHEMTAQLSQTQFTVDHATVGIFQVNWDGRIQYVNQAAASLTGFTCLELTNLTLQRLMPGFTVDLWLDFWHQMRQQQSSAFESTLARQGGGTISVEVTASYLAWTENEYVVCFVTDITERQRIQQALRNSEERFKGIAANVPGVVFQLEKRTDTKQVSLTYLSEASFALLGYSPEEIHHSQLDISRFVHPEDKASFELSWASAKGHLSDWHWQGRMLTDNQQVRWVDLKASMRHLSSDTIVWDGTLWDISENKRNELSLAETSARLRELSVHLETVREEEKARIAREVHDELGQVLTALKLETSMCELAFASQTPGLQERLSSMKKLIDQTIQMVRNVATALRPPVLDLGLPAALEWYARRFEARFVIPVAVTLPPGLPELADSEATALFRIVQEALTNVARHAEAGSVRIDLAMTPTGLTLTIADDGKGFDPGHASEERSFGLIGIRERVEMMGGSFLIESRLGQGTVLTVKVPLTMEHTRHD
ncbi:PAS domain-containing sensor histidine kinase [Leeia oryzae]|uniref:PAS domain-containing sensor histidine kinase n=1 Tax=Leeia oryzae TaxID=356662 RepID=UPI000368935E|nr:sensor histidine kinase [Leeia oryzae]